MGSNMGVSYLKAAKTELGQGSREPKKITGGTDKKQTYKCRHILMSLCKAVESYSSCCILDCCNVLGWRCSFNTALIY